jgi:hypothetical protein
MNPTYISDRLTSLKQEIHELRNLSARYRTQAEHSQADQSAYELQQLRLLHLKHEFCDLLKHSFRMRIEGVPQKSVANREEKSA